MVGCKSTTAATRMKNTLPQFIKLGLIILALGSLLAWIDSGFFEPKRLPPCMQEKLPEDRICLDTIFSQWKDKTVWIDARSQNDFEINHLRLADNRMFQIQPGAVMDEQIDSAIGRLLETEDNKECIIVFCTADCTKAEDVAKELHKLELSSPIYILEGGWDAIRKDGSLIK